MFAIIFTQFCTVTYYYWLCLSSHLKTCRHIWQMCSSHDLQMLLTVFVSFHLMTCRHFWQCLCSSISWPADTFNSVCVHPSHDLRHFWQCVHLSHDLQTHLTVCLSISWPAHFWQFVFVHLMTCRHFWQCLCPSILWPVDTFDNFCVHPSHDLHTFDNLSPSISWPADTFDSVCVHPSYDLQTLLTMFVSIHLITCRHFLCPSILWPADIFDGGFTSIHHMTYRHFLRWALHSYCHLIIQHSLFLFSTNCFQGTDAIILYFRYNDKDMLSTCGT